MPKPGTGTPNPRTIAATAYLLGFLSGAAVLWRYPGDPFVRFHAWQSILFSVALSGLVLAADFIPLLGLGLVFAFGLLGVATWALLLLQALRGRWFLLPLLGDIALERAGVDG